KAAAQVEDAASRLALRARERRILLGSTAAAAAAASGGGAAARLRRLPSSPLLQDSLLLARASQDTAAGEAGTASPKAAAAGRPILRHARSIRGPGLAAAGAAGRQRRSQPPPPLSPHSHLLDAAMDEDGGAKDGNDEEARLARRERALKYYSGQLHLDATLKSEAEAIIFQSENPVEYRVIMQPRKHPPRHIERGEKLPDAIGLAVLRAAAPAEAERRESH
ncbi:hypothetical protein HK405_000366, partial [Cladochytrium tenue]